MASPGPSIKKSKRLKAKAGVKVEEDIPQTPPPYSQEDADVLRGRKKSRKASASRLGRDNNDEAGASQPQPSRRTQDPTRREPNLATEDELASIIQLRDFYRAEAEEVAATRLSETEQEQLIGAVMRFMLFKHRQKPDQPVRRSELAKLFQGANKQSSTSASTWVIAQAQARFAKGLGLEMKEVEILPSRLAGKAEGQDAKGAKAYVMRSLLSPKARAIVKGPEVSQAFAMVVLALINLSPSKKLGKEQLYEYLSGLALIDKVEHPVLGKPEEQIALMLQKRYITEGTAGANDGASSIYYAGENALDEIPQDEMNQFIDKALRDAAIEIPDDSSPSAVD